MIAAIALQIPNVDPLGLPAPPQVFIALQLLTMLLHVLFMNFVLGGSLLALGMNVAACLGRKDANTMATLIYQVMPLAISMAVTMGVAPLLFVQVLYGPFFYSANVLLGFAWFSFVVVLLAGFYLAYWLSYRGSNALQRRVGRWDDRPGPRLLVGLLTTTAFLWVAWILTNNHEMSLHPGLWSDGAQWRSPRWYVPSATAIPRYLHNLVGATAIAGLWLAAIGWWRVRRNDGEPHVNLGMIRLGLGAAAVFTVIQVAVGLTMLFMLDPRILHQVMGFHTFLGGAWTLTLALAALLAMLLLYASLHAKRFLWFTLATAAAVGVLVGMLFGHEQIRLSSLALAGPKGFSLGDWPIYSQSTSMALFAILLVAALAIVALMMYWITDRRTPRSA